MTFSSMIQVAQLELSSLPKSHPLYKSKKKRGFDMKYIPDSRRLTLYQVQQSHGAVDNRLQKDNDDPGVFFEYSFDCDSEGELFIIDQTRYFPLDKQDYGHYSKFCKKMLSYLNKKKDQKISSLFHENAFIKVPACHAQPETFSIALRETAVGFGPVESIFKHEDNDTIAFTFSVVKTPSLKNQKEEGDAVCVIKFRDDFINDPLRIERLTICHT